MIFLTLITLLSSIELRADFVYMREDAQGKSVQWNKIDSTETLNATDDGQWAIYPDISPNANEFVFCEGPDQNNLHLTYLNKKKNLKQIFRLPGQGLLLHPKLSKNTQFIFYSAPGSKGKNTIFFFDRLATVTNQGMGSREFSLSTAQALDDSEEAYFPRPSSDGNFVVYQRNTAGKKEIILFDRLSNTKKVLAEGMSPSLSFDERFVAFTNKKEGNWNIYQIDRFSGEVIQMTNDSHDEMAPTYRPDNSLVFASNKSGLFELYSLENETWNKIVSDPSADFYSPQFSGDKKIEQAEKASFLGNPRPILEPSS